jgi:hypothetical protein
MSELAKKGPAHSAGILSTEYAKPIQTRIAPSIRMRL